MSKECRCAGCDKFLGIIEVGRLSTTITFLCIKCEGARIAAKQLLRDKPKAGDFGDIFKGIFK